MTELTSISVGIASRYAAAVFNLAKEEKALDRLEEDVASILSAVAASRDLQMMISSPVLKREEQESAIAAIAERMGLGDIVLNALKLMAQRRRLFVLQQFANDVMRRIATEKGESSVQVASAKKLSVAQAKRLTNVLSASSGMKIKLETTVDESLIGGLVVHQGSTMIDTSIRSKLSAFRNIMKEVG